MPPRRQNSRKRSSTPHSHAGKKKTRPTPIPAEVQVQTVATATCTQCSLDVPPVVTGSTPATCVSVDSNPVGQEPTQSLLSVHAEPFVPSVVQPEPINFAPDYQSNLQPSQGNNLNEISCTAMILHVPQKIKEQIWSGEFINLEQLLKKKDNSISKSTQNVGIAEGGNLIVRNETPKAISSIEIWTDAFLIYIQILIMKRPDLASSLLTYLNTIRLAQKRNADGWIEYDRLFRQKLAQSQNPQWSSVDGELWLLTMTPQSNQTSQKFCFSYNDTGYCTRHNCIYQHCCKICKGNHPALNCWHNNRNTLINFRPMPRGPIRPIRPRPRFTTPGPSFRFRPNAC